MPLPMGTRLGPYEILAPIGAGGMGEVYRARDKRLGRDVAIKTSQAKFSERFEREARAIAALNNPHICQIYDVGPDYLVMELVDGVPLQGPLPLERALPLVIQFADALDAAHRKGIIHRDLKPGNILATKSGIKVLDFGLARIEHGQAAGADDETVSKTLTEQGTIIGTPPYMSPEQVQGKVADARSDIFSFGCVLYEVLTGERAFPGPNAASVAAAILEREAPSVAEVAPAALDRLLKTCLAKDPDDRWQSARDLKRELEWIAAGGEAETQLRDETRSTGTSFKWTAVAALLMVALGTLAVVYSRKTPEEAPFSKLTILPPGNTKFEYTKSGSAPPVVSPDGGRLVFGAMSEDGSSQLYVRSLDSLEAKPLAGTRNASYPFWSPDSREICFFDNGENGKLMKVPAEGGLAEPLADVVDNRGGTWGPHGEIVYAPKPGGGLWKVAPGSGAKPAPVTDLKDTPDVNSHRWPWFLPDGKHFLYLAVNGGFSIEGEIRIGSIDPDERGDKVRRTLIRANSQAVYSQGYLLYLRKQQLMARPFDAEKFEVTGEEKAVAGEIAVVLTNVLRARFSVSSNGVLAYQTGRNGFLLAEVDRQGNRIRLVGDPEKPGNLLRLQLSPDRTSVAVAILAQDNNLDIWKYGLARPERTRLTIDSHADDHPVWSSDGKSIIFNSNREGQFDLFYGTLANGTGTEEPQFKDLTDKYPLSWSADNKTLLYFSNQSIWVLPMSGDEKPHRLLKTEFTGPNTQFSAQVSPDGRWLAYSTFKAQRSEIYVTSYPNPHAQILFSTDGGNFPRWRDDSKELFYVSPDQRLMAVEVKLTANGVEPGRQQGLFKGVNNNNGCQYDVFAAGRSFLMTVPVEQVYAAGPLTLVQRWTAELKKK